MIFGCSRAKSPTRRRTLPIRPVPKQLGGGHGWAAPPTVPVPVPGVLIPGGGGHGGPRQIRSQTDAGMSGVPGRLFSTEQLEEFYSCPITTVLSFQIVPFCFDENCSSKFSQEAEHLMECGLVPDKGVLASSLC